MTNKQGWTRRQFSQAMAVTAAGALLPWSVHASANRSLSGFAFLSSAPADGAAGAIHVYRVSGSGWQHVQSLSAVAPGHLLLHGSLPVLYVLHDVAEWKHLPRGAVSAYAIDSSSGRLTLAGTQPLSLAATHPRHATLTGDGRHLFVSAEGGGMYNLLAVNPQGQLQAVAAIRKEFGSANNDVGKVAAPGAVALHPDGTLLSVDPGQESLTTFRLRGSDLVVQGRERIDAGHGANQLAVTACGRRAYILGGYGRAISSYAVADQGMQFLDVQVQGPKSHGILLAPGARFLLASQDESTTVLRIAPENGTLSHHAQLEGGGQALSFISADGHLAALDRRTGAVRQTLFDAVQGTAAPMKTVAHVPNAVSLAFRPAVATDAEGWSL